MDASPNKTDSNLPSGFESGAPASLDAPQLSDIKAQLDLVLMAIEALTNIGSESVLEAAKTLQVDDILSDRVGLWRLRQSSPLRKGQGRKKLDVEEAKALVLVICHLSAAHHEQIRQAIAKLELATQQGKPPHRAAILGDYLDNFSNLYRDRMSETVLSSSASSVSNTATSDMMTSDILASETGSQMVAADGASQQITTQTLSQLSFRLLIDLLFYSAPGGERQLWLALLDRALSDRPAK